MTGGLALAFYGVLRAYSVKTRVTLRPPVFEIGNSLREARLRQGLEFPEIEHATKVRSKYLRALEDEEFDPSGRRTSRDSCARTPSTSASTASSTSTSTTPATSGWRRRARCAPPSGSRRGGPQSPAGRVHGARGLAVLTALVIAAFKFTARLRLDGQDVSSAREAHDDEGPDAARRAAKSVSVQIQATHGYGSYVVARVASPGGRQLYAGTLEPGKIQNFRSSRVWLRIDAPANVMFSVNGSRRALPGTGHPRIVVVSPGGRLRLAS